jgi:hypothetical protein
MNFLSLLYVELIVSYWGGIAKKKRGCGTVTSYVTRSYDFARDENFSAGGFVIY